MTNGDDQGLKAKQFIETLLQKEHLELWTHIPVQVHLDARGYPDQEELYRRFLAAGFHGGMAWLERHAPFKYHPDRLMPGVKTLVFVALNYYQERPLARGEGVVARYAWGRDYHKVLGGKLRKIQRELEEAFPQEAFRSFTDTSPLDERFWAALGGLGTRGRHGLVITRDWGSWVVLGEILTTLALPAPEPVTGAAQPGRGCPSGCRRCWEACPTGALGDQGLDARRCLAYHTIENQGALPPDLRPYAEGRVFGCDACQEACPLNLKAVPTAVPEFCEPRAGSEIVLAELFDLETEEEFTRRFGGSPVHRAGWKGMRRNACHAAANLGRRDLIPRLEKLAQGPDPDLAESALWALKRLRESD